MSEAPTMGIVRHETDELLRDLVRKLLTECKSVQCDYTLEHLLASLIPALVHVAKAWAEVSKGNKQQIQPLNMLAAHLYRNNPKVVSRSSKVSVEQRRVREMIVEEKHGLRRKSYDGKLKEAVQDEILKLDIWPLNSETNSPQRNVPLHGRTIKALLSEVEALSGRTGLRQQLEVVFEVLDVQSKRELAWPDLVYAMESFVNANKPGAFSKWLHRELRVKIDQALEEYYGTLETESLALKASQAGELTGSSSLQFLYEIRDAVLGWETTMEPETVMDARETKCSDTVRLTSADFGELLETYLERLTRVRLDTFGIFVL